MSWSPANEVGTKVKIVEMEMGEVEAVNEIGRSLSTYSAIYQPSTILACEKTGKWGRVIFLIIALVNLQDSDL